MPRKNKRGPSKKSKGPQDGHGGGKGRFSGSKIGTGAMTGGKKGIKKNNG